MKIDAKVMWNLMTYAKVGIECLQNDLREGRTQSSGSLSTFKKSVEEQLKILDGELALIEYLLVEIGIELDLTH